MNFAKDFLGNNATCHSRLICNNDQLITEGFKLDKRLSDAVQQLHLLGTIEIPGVFNQRVITV
jgi:hypothetical protein